MTNRVLMRKSLLAAGALSLALVVFATPVRAGAQQQDGSATTYQSNVIVGEMPPTDFVLESIDGETFELAAARGDKPLMLLFFRGTW